MFHKINWDYDMTPFHSPELTQRTDFTEPQRYGVMMREMNWSPVVAHVITGTARDYALSLLPKVVLEVEVPIIYHLDMDVQITNNPALTAHKDYNRRCALNGYLAANGEITHYYRWDRKASLLEETQRFVAKKGDWWLLDTDVLHSVTLIPNKRRTIISMSFVKTSFDDVKKLLGVASE